MIVAISVSFARVNVTYESEANAISVSFARVNVTYESEANVSV